MHSDADWLFYFQKMDDLFKIESQEPIEMNQEEFFEKTKAVLGKIMEIYLNAEFEMYLEEDDFPEEIVCKNCKGCGKFIHNDKEKECYKDNEAGECCHKFYDYEEVGAEIELYLTDIYDLLSVDKISSKE